MANNSLPGRGCSEVLLNLLVEHFEGNRAVARYDIVKLPDVELPAEAPPASVRDCRILS